MGSIEDSYWEVYTQIEKLGLREEFNQQLKEMTDSEKFKYMETHRRWEYACDKVVKKFRKKDD
jgi:hypothetical protein